MSIITEFILLDGMKFVNYFEDYQNLCCVNKLVNETMKKSGIYSATIISKKRGYEEAFSALDHIQGKKIRYLNVHVNTKYFFGARLLGLKMYMDSFNNLEMLNVRSIYDGHLDIFIREKMLRVFLQIEVFGVYRELFFDNMLETFSKIIFTKRLVNGLLWGENIYDSFMCHKNFFNILMCNCWLDIKCCKCRRINVDEYLM
jgi:hypothetical protein